MLSIRRILVPVDFSGPSKVALDYAARMATSFGATLQVLHVWDSPNYFAAGVGELTVSVPEGRTTLAQFVRTRAGKELEQLLSDIQRRSTVKVTGRLEMGDPCDGILKTAANGHHDMIVMGTHGRTGLSHLFLGSVAERVVRRAPCPVVTIRSGDVTRASGAADDAQPTEGAS